MRNIIKEKTLFVIKYFIGLALLFWILSRVDRKQLAELFLSLPASTVLSILGLSFVNLFFQFNLWKYLIERHSGPHPIGDLLASFLAGFTFRLMLPGGHAEITKVFLISGRKRGKIIAFGIEKLFQTLLKILLISLVVPLVFPEYKLLLWSISGITLIGFLVLPFVLRTKRINSFQEKDVSYGPIFWVSFIHYIPIFFCIAGQYFLMLSLGYTIAFDQIMIVTVFIWAAGLLPISISGLGVRENLAAFILSRYAVDSATAVGTSLFIFFINAIVPAIIGVFIILKYRHSLRNAGSDIKNMASRYFKKSND